MNVTHLTNHGELEVLEYTIDGCKYWSMKRPVIAGAVDYYGRLKEKLFALPLSLVGPILKAFALKYMRLL